MSSRRSSTSVRSSTSAAWTDSCTCPSCRGSTSTTRARSCRSATRSPSRCSTSTSPASASRCRSRPPSRTRGRSSPPATRSASSSTDGSPSWCPSARSSRWAKGIEGLVHISEMAVHHVEAPEQVVTPGEELWVKIIDIDLDRRRISLSIKQAAEGGVVAAEYQEHYGEHAYDEQGNYIGPAFEEEADEGAERRGDAGAEGAVDAAPDESGADMPPTSCAEAADRRSLPEASDDRRPDAPPRATTRRPSNRIPGKSRVRVTSALKAAPTRADHLGTRTDPEGSRGVESSNVDGRRGHRARARSRYRRVHVRVRCRQARPGATRRSSTRTSPTRTSPRARPVPSCCRPGSSTRRRSPRARCPRRLITNLDELERQVLPRARSARSSSSPRGIVRVGGGRRRRRVLQPDRGDRTSSRSRSRSTPTVVSPTRSRRVTT